MIQRNLPRARNALRIRWQKLVHRWTDWQDKLLLAAQSEGRSIQDIQSSLFPYKTIDNLASATVHCVADFPLKNPTGLGL